MGLPRLRGERLERGRGVDHHGSPPIARTRPPPPCPPAWTWKWLADCYRTDLPGLLDAGRVSSATLDTAVRRILRVKILKGLLDHPYTAPPI